MYNISMDIKICSKCKASKPKSEYYKQNDRTAGIMPSCKSCTNARNLVIRRKRKYEAVQYKGGKCEKCGILCTYSNYPIFDFHHIDPNEKSFNWSHMQQISWVKRKAELDKCACLCSNCHRLTHREKEESENQLDPNFLLEEYKE